MTWTQPTYRWLIWTFAVLVGLQFFLAGLGVLGGESIGPHQGLGSLLQLLAVIQVIVAAIGPFEPKLKGMSFALVVITVLQSIWVIEDLSPMWLHSFHVLGAFLIAGLSQQIAKAVGRPW